jgi:hypothetical protein
MHHARAAKRRKSHGMDKQLRCEMNRMQKYTYNFILSSIITKKFRIIKAFLQEKHGQQYPLIIAFTTSMRKSMVNKIPQLLLSQYALRKTYDFWKSFLLYQFLIRIIQNPKICFKSSYGAPSPTPLPVPTFSVPPIYTPAGE